MEATFIFTLLAACLAQVVEKDGHFSDFREANFDDEIQKHDNILLESYAPCTYSFHISADGSLQPVCLPPDIISSISILRHTHQLTILARGEVVCTIPICNPTQGGKGCVKIWDVSLRNLKPPAPLWLDCLRNNSYYCCADGNIAIRDIRNQSLVRQFQGRTDGASSIEISHEGTKIWSRRLDSTVRTWDIGEIYLASTSQLGHTIRRSRNYIRDINPTTMKAIWPNKIIHYRLAIVGVFSDSYVDKILAVIRMINRISCLEFTRVPTGDTLPPKTVAGLTLEPVVVFTKVTTEKECFAVINNNRIQVLLHDTICGSSVDIMAVTLSVLGAIIPKGSNLRLYDLMPWNLRDFDDMRQHCNMDNALQADPPEVDFIPHTTIRDLNQMYCAGFSFILCVCGSPPQCQNHGVVDSRGCTKCICPEGFSGPLCDKLTRSNGRTSAWCKSNTQTVNDEKQVISFGTADLSLQSYSPPQDCTWLFTAPPGRKIRFQFTGNAFGYNCTRECICRDYLEIRDTVQDMSIKGYRFCCTLLTKRTIISKSNKLLVISHIHSSGSRGFQGLIYLAAENAASGLT